MKNWQIVGIHSVKEALKRRPKEVHFVALKESNSKQADIAEIENICKKKKIEVRIWNEKRFSQLAAVHQNVAAELKAIASPELEDLGQKEQSLVIVLDGIEDPHNLGAILRSSWLLEAEAIIIPKDRAAKLSATAIKVACGGAEHVPVITVTNLSSSLQELKEQGYWIYGLAEGGEQNLFQWEPADKTVIVVGAEDKGMRKSTRGQCDQIVEIWQTKGGASFNASVAAALAMNRYRQCFQK
ncbi:MAG: 23S rRNA (guanosine(2251)-2'-O)-methyltransferase RlmB [Bdellovibrionota bacterium]